MNITVFGAGGKVGRLVVAALLGQGHSVTAFVHSSSPFETSAHLSIVQGDVHDRATVLAALRGCDAVICTLGSWGTPSKDILTSAMQGIVPAMQELQITRIISLTGADARAEGDVLSLVHKASYPLLKFTAGKVLQDGEQHIQLLEKSALEWTVIRSPIMNTFGKSSYKLTAKRPLPIQTIHRQAVADAIIKQLDLSSNIRQSPFISRV